MYTIKIKETAHAIPSWFEFEDWGDAMEALPKLKLGCCVGDGSYAVFNYDPRKEEGGPAIESGVRT